MAFRIKMEIDIGKLNNLLDDDVRTFSHMELWRLMYRYMPFDLGNLRNDVDINAERIMFNSDYARFQYYGLLMLGEETHSAWARKDEKKYVTPIELHYNTDRNPDATSHWLEVVEVNDKDKLLRAIRKYILEKKKK